MAKTLLSLGHGYSARALARRLAPLGWRIIGTTRKPESAEAIRAEGAEPIAWDRSAIMDALSDATHLLSSVSPDRSGDPALNLVGDAIKSRASALQWAGYLSTTGVYGDRQGGWVSEADARDAGTQRGQARVEAEDLWSAIPDLKLHIFRLAGIYGPGRGPFSKVRKGTARRIIKPGQVFSRIHVDDIAQVVHASIDRPNPGAAYNVCDDDPAPPQDVIAFAADLLGLPRPPETAFDDAELSPMARSFYAESKRVTNNRIKEELGVSLLYPDYRSGLEALLAAER